MALPPDAIAQPVLPGSSGPVVLERFTRDRWIHEGQHPGFVPYDTLRQEIQLVVTSRRPPLPTRTMHVEGDAGNAFLVLDPTNRVVDGHVERPAVRQPVRQPVGQGFPDRAETRRQTLRGPGAMLNLPETRL